MELQDRVDCQVTASRYSRRSLLHTILHDHNIHTHIEECSSFIMHSIHKHSMRNCAVLPGLRLLAMSYRRAVFRLAYAHRHMTSSAKLSHDRADCRFNSPRPSSQITILLPTSTSLKQRTVSSPSSRRPHPPSLSPASPSSFPQRHHHSAPLCSRAAQSATPP